AARAEAKNAKGMQSVRMKLGAMCTLSPSIMSDFIVGFQRKNEGVNVHVRDGNAQTLVQKLSAGDMEIGVLAFPEALDDRFHVMPLFQERFVCVLPKEHPLAAKNAVTAQDLDNQPYVNRVACEYIDFAAQQFAALGVNIRIVFRSERDDWVLSMVRAGLGWAFYPEFSPIPDDVVVRPLVEPEFVRTVSLVTVRGRPHSPAVGAFVRAARAHQWPRLDQGSSIAA
ncbi:MAG: LysR family transcriptional regulator substrate-binding protein, partial [Hyphomonadaceae bacterium]